MDLTIRQNCPSCGAQIELYEADRLVRCHYCDVQNFMVTRGPLRFILPDKVPAHIDRREIFYAPYLRFKGNIYYCKGKYQKYKVVDTTRQGLNASALPQSLGLRPQAMAMSLVTKEVKGVFLHQTIKARTLLEQAAQLTVIDSEDIKEPFYHRAYIGETLSCIYLPLYIDDDVLYDGVTNSPLARGGSSKKMIESGKRFSTHWTPHFLATLCPRCGDSLNGEHDSQVLSCYNCHSSWEEKQGGFEKIAWSSVSSDNKGDYSLPFWKLKVHATGIAMKSFAEFLRITNQPLVIRKRHEEVSLSFFVPAFKLRPSTFLRLGQNMTLGQLKIPLGEVSMVKRMHPVTLPRKEAIQALKSILAGSALNKKQLLQRLPDIHFKPLETELIYLPFNNKGHDIVQKHTGLSLAKSILHFGRKL
jgi:DNA-directed RNA polymerase subunit RPC12/RpoP